MNRMRLAMCVAVFALVGGIAFSQDMDIRALQAKLAAQEARLNDLQSKMSYAGNAGGTADNVVSLRKNGKVTIGGDINTRYYFYDGEVKSNVDDQTVARVKEGDVKSATLRVSDAKLRVKVDVNDYFEAFIRVDLQDNNANRAFTAQEAYVRWKNVCNSGFSLLVGRTGFVFGGGNEAGSVLTGYYGGDGEGQIGDFNNEGLYTRTRDVAPAAGGALTTEYGDNGEGMFAVNGDGFMPSMLGYDLSRVTQITGSWATQDGRFLAEASLFQGLDSMRYENRSNRHNRDGDRRSLNYGLGSGSVRFTWKPIEGLKLVASAANLHQNVSYTDGTSTYIPGLRSNGGKYTTALAGPNRASANDTAINLHAAWNPCFLPAFKIWGAYVHNWNAGWVDGLDGSVYQLGVSYNFTDKLSAFALGEYMNHKNDRATDWYKSKAWASYMGVKYNVGYGVNLEAGWRHEDVKFKARSGNTHTKANLDIIYGHLGFSF